MIPCVPAMKANESNEGATNMTTMQRTHELPRSRFMARVIASSALAAAFGLISNALAADVERNPDRNAYFGETHQHTSWSFDAFFIFGKVTLPARRMPLPVLSGRNHQAPAGV